MKFKLLRRVACLAGLMAVLAGAVEIPAGQILEVRLSTAAITGVSKAGDRLEAILISPVMDAVGVVAPAGSRLLGCVAKAQALGMGFKNGRAQMSLLFDRIVVPGLEPVPVRTTLVHVDTARERVNGNGQIDGISPAISASSALATYAWRLVILEPAIGAAVWGVKFLMAPAPDPEIRLPVGAELLLRVIEPVTLNYNPEPMRLRPLEPAYAAELLEWLNSRESLRIMRKSGAPGDPINLVFVGRESAMLSAFAAAGWSKGEIRHATSLAKTYFHLIQRKGYATGPMAPMTYQGAAPAYTFQKTLNTFSRRHHLRIWNTGTDSAGVTRWAVAGTEDTDIHFSGRSWTHEIDPEIDHERSKIATDLLYTGCVTAMSLLDAQNGDVPGFVTDGAVAALRLNECESPRAMPTEPKATKGRAFARTMKAFGKDIVRSNLATIALTDAHVPPQAFTSKAPPENYRATWANQQATLWKPRVDVK